MQKLLRIHEFYVGIIIVVFVLVVGAINPAFYSVANVFDLLKSNIVIGIFAMGVLLVLISGGIDISFPAVGVVAMYLTGKYFDSVGFNGPIIVAFVIAAALGMIMGAINAAIISTFKLPTLIVSLGTLSAYHGFLLTFVGTRIINRLTPPMVAFSRTELFRQTLADGQTTGLSVSIFIYLALALLTSALLRYTTLGRGIYALGGDRQAAERAGFNVRRIEYFIYIYVGFLAGIAGIIHSSQVRNANPFDLVGSELNVIAATVLGGASLGGGRGTVAGTALGVMLVVLMNNSLILLGIPSYWQRFTVGMILLIAVAAPQIVAHRRSQSEVRK